MTSLPLQISSVGAIKGYFVKAFSHPFREVLTRGAGGTAPPPKMKLLIGLSVNEHLLLHS